MSIATAFGTEGQEATVSQERGTIRMLTPDLALWQGGMTIQPGGGAPSLQGTSCSS